VRRALSRIACRVGQRRVATPALNRVRAPGLDQNSLTGLLHELDPYADFDDSGLTIDLQGWGSDSPIFAKLIEEVRPQLVIEVGSWKGGSAIEMAKQIQARHLDCKIFCVDTWLGSLEHWQKKDSPKNGSYRSLRLRHGFPHLYDQFLYNVMATGVRDVIIPFPTTSLTAARWFEWKGIKADLIYIDASHEEPDVYQDLHAYEAVLSSDGVIFGDDWRWEGVQSAVQRFVAERSFQLELHPAPEGDATPRNWVLRASGG
jgi:predicted O-methyltransferase YrrM